MYTLRSKNILVIFFSWAFLASFSATIFESSILLTLDPDLTSFSTDDADNKVTLLSASSVEKDIKSGDKVNKTELSKIVATKLAKKAQEKKITKIYFDRGIYRYHGRVKAFAETLRENGMEF